MGLDKLRQRSKSSEEILERKLERVRGKVVEVVNSSTFVLTAAEHNTDTEKNISAFADNVASAVANVICDAKAEFIDICTARGLKKTEIRRAANVINMTFGLTTSTEDDDILEAVAKYMQENPSMYDQIVLFSTNH